MNGFLLCMKTPNYLFLTTVNLPEVEDISPPDSPKKAEPAAVQPVKPQPAAAVPLTAVPSPKPSLFGFTAATTAAQPTGLFGTGKIMSFFGLSKEALFLLFERQCFTSIATHCITQGFHIYWKTWKNIVHLENLEKSWNFANNNKNHGNIMEFCQSGNVGTLGYCENDIFLIR